RHPGGDLPAHRWPPRVPHGAHPSPLRTGRLARDHRDRPLLVDHGTVRRVGAGVVLRRLPHKRWRAMKALVLGIGADGLGSKALLEREGAEVIVADDATAPLKRLPPDIEVVVPRPGVKPTHPLLRAAARQGVAIWSEVEVAARGWK